MTDKISPSQAKTWLRCQCQWYFRYIERLKIPPGVALVMGSAVHHGSEAKLAPRVRGVEEPTDEQTVERAVSYFETAVKKEGLSLKKGETLPKVVAAGVDKVALGTKVLVADVLPLIQKPISVERWFSLELEGKDYELNGRIDIEEKGMVRDVKTGKPPKPREELQPGVYTYAYEALYGEAADFCYDCIKTGNKTPTYQPVKVDNPGVAYVLHVIDSVYNAIQAAKASGLWVPNPGGWHCSPDWCGYWDICRGGAKW